MDNTLELKQEDQFQNQEKVNIVEFAELVGFPVELIKKELFTNQTETNEVSMSELRGAMLKYLDKTML